MKKLIFIPILFLTCSCFAQETIVNYDENSLPVLNENFRRNDERIRTLENNPGTFISATDTPSSFSGKAGFVASVNATEDSVEFKYEVIDDDSMATASDTSIPTAESTKTYIDSIDFGEVFSADDTIIARNDGVDTNLGSLTKKKEFHISNSGELRISFTLSIGGASGETGIGRIYRNGSAVGTLRSVTSASSPTTFTEDISGWSIGDKVQLYIGTTVGGLAVSATNFQLKSSTYGIPMRLLLGTTAATDRGYVSNL